MPLLLALTEPLFGGEWQLTEVDQGNFCSLALDSGGLPSIAYINWNTCTVNWAAWNGSSWNIIPAGTPGAGGGYTSIALAQSGFPCITWYHNTVIPPASALMYAEWNGSSFDVCTISEGGNHGLSNSLVLDSQSNPHVSFSGDSYGTLYYAWRNGSSWMIQTVTTSGTGSKNSIDLSSSNTPGISYSGSGGNLEYAWQSGSWFTATADSTVNSVQGTSMAFSSSGMPRVAYFDYFPGMLKYASWNGFFWCTETVDSSGSAGFGCSLELDENDVPRISYCDGEQQVLKYARKEGGSWMIEAVAPIGSSCSGNTSIALDPSGNPHISYIDYTSNSVMYAYYQDTPVDEPASIPTGRMSLQVYSGIPSAVPPVLLLSLQSAGEVEITVHDISGRLVFGIPQTMYQAGVQTLQIPHLTPGAYLCSVFSDHGVISQRFIVL